MSTAANGRRYTDNELAEIALAPEPGTGRGGRGPGGREFQQKLQKFLADEQPAVVLRAGAGRSDGGTVFGGSAGSRDPKDPVAPPTVVITPEHYNRICRLLEHKIPVKLEFDIQTKFQDTRQDSVDVIGEIEGGTKKDEVVMLGAHLDSWHGGTGATDNAAGSAVMIEAMRILKSLNVKMDRTVRMGLWGGEEEGLLGSKAYVKEHFGDPATMKITAEQPKLSGYFNVDNGTGRIRGVYLQGNDMMRPIFEQWFAPLKDLTEGVISIRNTGGADHLSRMTPSGFPDSSSSRTPWSTTPRRTIRIWMSMIESRAATCSRCRRSWRRSCITRRCGPRNCPGNPCHRQLRRPERVVEERRRRRRIIGRGIGTRVYSARIATLKVDIRYRKTHRPTMQIRPRWRRRC